MITPEKLADQLHIDSDPQELELLTDLIAQATDIVKSSVNYKLSDAVYEQYPLYERAVSSLATQLYYDRTLDAGTAKGVTMMITHLQARLGGVK